MFQFERLLSSNVKQVTDENIFYSFQCKVNFSSKLISHHHSTLSNVSIVRLVNMLFDVSNSLFAEIVRVAMTRKYRVKRCVSPSLVVIGPLPLSCCGRDLLNLPRSVQSHRLKVNE